MRRHIWGYSVCLRPIKGTPGLNELKVIAGVIVNILVAFVYDLGSLTSPTSVQKQTLGVPFLRYP